MPKNPVSVTLTRRAIQRLTQTQPIHVQEWVAISGDGLTSAQVYAFSYSYVGAVADTRREVFRDREGRGSGSISVKNMVVVVPYTSGMPTPQRNHQFILYQIDGTPLPRMRVLSVVPRTAGTVGVSQNTVYANEIHLELLES